MSLSREEQIKRIKKTLNKTTIPDETLSHHTIEEKIKAIKWQYQYRQFDEKTLNFVESIEVYFENMGTITPKQNEALDRMIINNRIEV
jgi:deoxycytidylate deaminase